MCVPTDLDEPNVRGRYSVHFHRAGVVDTPAASVRGSVATDNPGWAYVNHSSNVDFVGNVAYDVDGAAFNTESGDEIGSFVDNISIRSHGTGGAPVDRQFLHDFGHAGHGFWFQGPGVTVEGNVATGATGAGFIFYSESLVEPHAGRVWFPAANLPFVQSQTPFRLLIATLAASVAGMIYYWPKTSGWWHKDVWWVVETAREGMGMMILTVVLIVVVIAARRRPQSVSG